MWSGFSQFCGSIGPGSPLAAVAATRLSTPDSCQGCCCGQCGYCQAFAGSGGASGAASAKLGTETAASTAITRRATRYFDCSDTGGHPIDEGAGDIEQP